jgi:ectoine hydroxylase-related dioxygenase (phytanoyl-CoA dioxygenase family)
MTSTTTGLERHAAPITDAFPSAAGDLSPWDLSAEQRASFDTHGYLAPIPLLDTHQVAELRTRIANIADHLDEHSDLLYEVESAWTESPADVVLHFLGAWRVDPWIHDLIQHPGITVPLAQILGTPRLRFWHDQVFWKPPHHPGVVPWHQDYSYWQRTTPENHISIHIALDDSDLDSGCLHFIPGSHRWPTLPAPSFGGDIDQIQAHLGDTQRAEFHPVPAPLRAGEASIHHSSTLHGSHANTSPRPRRGLVLNFMGPDTRCADGTTPLLAGCPLIPTGALIEGPLFPIALDRTHP